MKNFKRNFRWVACWVVSSVLLNMSISAQDTTSRANKIDFSGYLSSLQSTAFDRIDNTWLTNQLLHNRLNMNASLWQEKVKVFVGLRNRLIWGERLDANQLIPATVSNQTGWIDANYELAKGQSYRLNADFDRFYVTYETGNVAISAGRQRINWSQTFVWNPNDLFNAYSFYDIDYVERPGSDAIRLQYFPTEVSTAEAAMKVDRDGKITAGLLYRFNTHGYDLQLLGGVLEERDYVAGLGWSGSLAGRISFRGELTLLHPDSTPVFSRISTLASLAADYTTSSSLSLQGEYFFNQLAPTSFNQSTFLSYLTTTGNIKTLSPSKHNLVMQVSYPFTPLFNGSLAILYMPSIKGYYYAPSLAYSLAQNIDASLFWQAFALHLESNPIRYNLIMLRLKFYW
ncbi:MAG TPA: hypothetical protein PLD12_06190 [Bacteroidales bacterium]|mgnify:CR=1 FL=1|nr:hypothetical protein [Bacteroidales bacterium]HOK98712.1 hypothetical protein [Bacteroidales bacterium]HPO65610.1 hypothetical protein [Bacteroidales bacterium]